MKPTKQGHGPGKGMVSISTSVSSEINAQIVDLAEKSDLSRGAWCREVIVNSVRNRMIIGRSYYSEHDHLSLVAETPSKPAPQSSDAAPAAGGGVLRPEAQSSTSTPASYPKPRKIKSVK